LLVAIIRFAATSVSSLPWSAAILGAEFRLLAGTGYMLQMETSDQLLQAAWDFADTHASQHTAR
jgi:hypothetical protein